MPVTLTPGNPAPFTWAATPVPGAVGPNVDQWHGRICTAQWDVVPYQYVRLTNFLDLTVIAGHQSTGATYGGFPGDMGMDRVLFACNGGTVPGQPNDTTGWVAANVIEFNPATGLFGFTARITASDFPGAGLYEVRFIAYPNSGLPRVGESLYLYVDPTDALGQEIRYVTPGGAGAQNGLSPANAVGTINAAISTLTQPNNALILLSNGNHTWGNTTRIENSNSWLTVRADTSGGATRANCIIKQTEALNIQNVKLERVSIEFRVDSGAPLGTYTTGPNTGQPGPPGQGTGDGTFIRSTQTGVANRVWFHDVYVRGDNYGATEVTISGSQSQLDELEDRNGYRCWHHEDQWDAIYITGSQSPIPAVHSLGTSPTHLTGAWTVIQSCRFAVFAGKIIRNVYCVDAAEDTIRYDWRVTDPDPHLGKFGVVANFVSDRSNFPGHSDVIQIIQRGLDYHNFAWMNVYGHRIGGDGSGTSGAGVQGFFSDASVSSVSNAIVRDYLICNFIIDQFCAPSGGKKSKWKYGGDNGKFWHCDFANQMVEWLPHRQDEGGTSSSGPGYQVSGQWTFPPWRPHSRVQIRNSTFMAFGWHWTGGNGTPTGTLLAGTGPRPEFDTLPTVNDVRHCVFYQATIASYAGSFAVDSLVTYPGGPEPTGKTMIAVVASSNASSHNQYNALFTNYAAGNLTPAAGPLDGSRTQGLLDAEHLATISPSLVPALIVPYDILGNARPLNPSIGAIELYPTATPPPPPPDGLIVNALDVVRQNTQVGLTDLVLTNNLNQPLPFVVLSDTPGGDLWLAVRLPVVDASLGQTFYLYFDNPTAPLATDLAAVTAGYRAMYFFKDWPGGGVSINDNLAFAQPGAWPSLIPMGNPTPAVGSPLPGGYTLDGNDWLDLGSTPNLESTNQCTIRVVVKFDDFTNFDRILSKSDFNSEQNHAWMLSITSAEKWRGRLKTGTDPASGTTLCLDQDVADLEIATSTVTTDPYYLISMTYDGSFLSMVEGGTVIARVPKTGNIFQNSWPTAIGANPSVPSAEFFFTGQIALLLAESTYRDPEWLASEAAMLANPGSFAQVTDLQLFSESPSTPITLDMVQGSTFVVAPPTLVGVILLTSNMVQGNVTEGILYYPGSPTLIVGPGWSNPGAPAPNPVPTTVVGVTQTPYRTEEAIAQWLVVPYSDLTTGDHVSVLTFHGSAYAYANSGAFEVRVALDGPDNPAEWAVASDMTYNEDLDLWAHNTTFLGIGLDSGTVRQLLAISYPNDGEPHILSVVPVFTKFGTILGGAPASREVDPVLGSDQFGSTTVPFATIQAAIAHMGSGANGGIVYLRQGNHTFNGGAVRGQSNSTYVRIVNHPSNIDPAVISDWGLGIDSKLVKFEGITIDSSTPFNNNVPYARTTPNTDYVWFDGCEFLGPGALLYPAASVWAVDLSYEGRTYITGCTISNYARGLRGAYVWNSVLNQIGEQFFQNCHLVANVRGDNSGQVLDHPGSELALGYSTAGDENIEQVIIYNTRLQRVGGSGPSPGFEGVRVANRENTTNTVCNNIAIVNSVFDQSNEPPESGRPAQVNMGGRHLVLIHSTVGQWLKWTPHRQDEVLGGLPWWPFPPLGPYIPMAKPLVLNCYFERFSYNEVTGGQGWDGASGGNPLSPIQRSVTFVAPSGGNAGSLLRAAAGFINVDGLAVGMAVNFVSPPAALQGLTFLIATLTDSVMTFSTAADSVPVSINGTTLNIAYVAVIPPSGVNDHKTPLSVGTEFDADGVFLNNHIRVVSDPTYSSQWLNRAGPLTNPGGAPTRTSAGGSEEGLFEGYMTTPVTGYRRPVPGSQLTGAWRALNVGATQALRVLPADIDGTPYLTIPSIGAIEVETLEMLVEMVQGNTTEGLLQLSQSDLPSVNMVQGNVVRSVLTFVISLPTVNMVQGSTLSAAFSDFGYTLNIDSGSAVVGTLNFRLDLPALNIVQGSSLVAAFSSYGYRVDMLSGSSVTGTLSQVNFLTVNMVQGNTTQAMIGALAYTLDMVSGSEVEAFLTPEDELVLGRLTMVSGSEVVGTIILGVDLAVNMTQGNTLTATIETPNVAVRRRRRDS